jgi:hypothetical protein
MNLLTIDGLVTRMRSRVRSEADIWLRKVRQQPRKILRYDKANWDNIKSDLEDTLKKIININNDAKSTVRV